MPLEIKRVREMKLGPRLVNINEGGGFSRKVRWVPDTQRRRHRKKTRVFCRHRRRTKVRGGAKVRKGMQVGEIYVNCKTRLGSFRCEKRKSKSLGAIGGGHSKRRRAGKRVRVRPRRTKGVRGTSDVE